MLSQLLANNLVGHKYAYRYYFISLIDQKSILDQSFLHLSTTDILSWIILCWGGGSSVHGRMFGSILAISNPQV